MFCEWFDNGGRSGYAETCDKMPTQACIHFVAIEWIGFTQRVVARLTFRQVGPTDCQAP